ncbi:uncharacterized protein N7518_004562 [Penicillium psychrosexuale]|uniref:uncharacterized protein n=1 Tax=Penicillium psychrosexuale TaxID=1002107 RepID=UPI0025456E5B|nr:uncharacterized protein N7518_004562 [Penicillium psychrosexuale]KAJ5796022.1 hypothetical protein N7518_004562 [Penicillium psychrosexuale]
MTKAAVYPFSHWVALFRPSDVAAPVPIQEKRKTWLAARGSLIIKAQYEVVMDSLSVGPGALGVDLRTGLYVIQLAWPG